MRAFVASIPQDARLEGSDELSDEGESALVPPCSTTAELLSSLHIFLDAETLRTVEKIAEVRYCCLLAIPI